MYIENLKAVPMGNRFSTLMEQHLFQGGNKMRINNNIMALNTYNQMTTNNSKTASSIEKLSSGLRINSAADDAAGLAISEKMRSQIRGLDQASRNAQDGISMIQTAEGALDESEAILQRMRELSVQSSNDTYTAEDREAIQDEIKQLSSEIDRISTDTEFNNKSLLDGSLENSTQVTNNNAKVNDVKVENDSMEKGDYVLTVSGTAETYTTGATNSTNIGSITDGGTGSTAPGEYTVELVETEVAGQYDIYLKDDEGTVIDSKNSFAIDNATADVVVDIGGVNITYADVSGGGTAVAEGTSEFSVNSSAVYTLEKDGKVVDSTTTVGSTSSEVELGGLSFTIDDELADNTTNIAVSNNAVTYQIGANSGQTTDMTVSDMSSKALGIDELDLTTSEGATSAIDVLDDAIKSVSSERSKLGAMQNRLEHTINNLSTSSENLSAAESRIRDVDMAKEMMEMTKWTTLQQSSNAMLAQANSQPEQVLQLLR